MYRHYMCHLYHNSMRKALLPSPQVFLPILVECYLLYSLFADIYFLTCTFVSTLYICTYQGNIAWKIIFSHWYPCERISFRRKSTLIFIRDIIDNLCSFYSKSSRSPAYFVVLYKINYNILSNYWQHLLIFSSCVHFYDQEQYLLVKVQFQSFAGMITQDSERS